MMPQLESHGDSEERQHWPHLKSIVPHYEVFWARYVVPLRTEGSIWFKRDIDPRLEVLAITSYSTFQALARARFKIFEDHEDFRHLEELYMLLQRAAELGVKLVKEFNDIESAYAPGRRSLNVTSLESLIESRLKTYRNLLHDARLSMPKDQHGRRIPKPEKLADYVRWSHTMFSFREEDYVLSQVQVTSDFYATATALESAWKIMTQAYASIAESKEFCRALHQGTPAQVPSAAVSVSASGSFSIGKLGTDEDDAGFKIEPLPKRK